MKRRCNDDGGFLGELLLAVALLGAMKRSSAAATFIKQKSSCVLLLGRVDPEWLHGVG